MTLIMPLFFKDSIKFLLKLSKYGSIAVYTYIVFIFYIFIENLVEGRMFEENTDVSYF